MIAKSILAAGIASGLALPPAPALYVPPKPAIIKSENLEFSKNLLAMPFTMGMLPGKASGVTLNTQNTTVNTTTATTTTYTFTAQSIGAANATRIVFAFIWGRLSTNSLRSISSVTIGGVSATVRQRNDFTASSLVTAIAYAIVPTGTTADVVVTFSANMTACSCVVSSYNGVISSTPVGTLSAAASGTTATGTLAVTAAGVLVANAGSGSVLTHTWTGATEVTDGAVAGYNGSSAEALIASTNASYTVTVTYSGTPTAGGLVAASFR